MSDAEARYRSALTLYKDTTLSIKEICEQTGTPLKAFSSYLQRHHRNLMFARHGVVPESENNVNSKLREQRGQSSLTHVKYKDAILACEDIQFIEYNISEIARLFSLSPSGLNNQLHYHFPQILKYREAERQRRGINDNRHRGAKANTAEQYSLAVEHLRNSNDSIEKTACRFNLSYPGLREFILRYHKELVKNRLDARIEAKGSKKPGGLTGNGTLHSPSEAQRNKYEEAIKLYRDTSLTQKEIALKMGLSLSGLQNYIRIWNRDIILERRGVEIKEGEIPELSASKHYLKSTATKYADAIDRIKTTGEATNKVAKEFGLNPEVFREYLYEHEPELARKLGRIQLENGKKVLARSAEKYDEAIRIFANSAENLKSIAIRLGLNYKSLSSFIKRNRQDAIESHNKLLDNSKS